MNEDFILKSINDYYIVDSDLPSDSSIEMPDGAKELGCAVGKVVQTPIDYHEESSLGVGKVIFYDGSKSFKLHTSEGDYIAVNISNIIAYIE